MHEKGIVLPWWARDFLYLEDVGNLKTIPKKCIMMTSTYWTQVLFLLLCNTTLIYYGILWTIVYPVLLMLSLFSEELLNLISQHEICLPSIYASDFS